MTASERRLCILYRDGGAAYHRDWPLEIVPRASVPHAGPQVNEPFLFEPFVLTAVKPKSPAWLWCEFQY